MSAAERALMANCPLGHCWRSPGTPCDPRGSHLARWQRAYRRGLVTRDELAAVVETLTVIDGRVIVEDSVSPERAA